jgi:hypothetical protein
MSSIFFSLWDLKLQIRNNFNETPENCQIIFGEKNRSESLYLGTISPNHNKIITIIEV